jgi:Stage II sporulation protein
MIRRACALLATALLAVGSMGAAKPSNAAVWPQTTMTACGHNSSGWTSATTPPSTIRVLPVTEVNATTYKVTGAVQTVSFSQYVTNVLIHEWGVSAPWASLQAGAMAVRDYAWYFVLHGSKGTLATNNPPNPCSYDVDSSNAYQVYIPGVTLYTPDQMAVSTTWQYSMTLAGTIPIVGYCNELTPVNGNICRAGTSDTSCGAHVVSGHLILSQTGADVCAADDHTFESILATYYPGVAITQTIAHPAVAVNSDGSTEIATIDSAGHLDVTSSCASCAGGFQAWKQIPGGPFIGTPALAQDSRGNMFVVARTATGALEANRQQGTATSWAPTTETLPGVVEAVDPSLIRLTDGQLIISGANAQGQGQLVVETSSGSAAFNTPIPLGNAPGSWCSTAQAGCSLITSSVGVREQSAGCLAVGTSQAMTVSDSLSSTCLAGWGNWTQQTTVQTSAAPSVTTDATGRVAVLIRTITNNDGQLEQTSPGQAPLTLCLATSTLCHSPALPVGVGLPVAAADGAASGALVASNQASTGATSFDEQTATVLPTTWGSALALGGGLVPALSTCITASGHIILAARSVAGTVYTNTRSGTVWSGWSALVGIP